MDKAGESKNFFSENIHFIVFLAVFALLAWEVTAPIAKPVAWSALLAFIFAPVNRFIGKRLLRGKRPGLSAAATMLLALCVCVAPLLYALSTLASEATGMGSLFLKALDLIKDRALNAGSLELPSWVPPGISAGIYDFLNDTDAVNAALQSAAQWGAKILRSVSARVLEESSGLAFNAVVIIMTLFFFIRDGEKIAEYAKDLPPLRSGEREKFFASIGESLNSIVYGAIVTVAAQALVGGLGWRFVGLESPALFGMLMFFFGMFPAGTAVVWVPGAAYLALNGDFKNAAILFFWGAAVVSVIDNFLRPFLISGGRNGAKIPTLLIITGLFGGVTAWGFLGIFLGPLILALFLSVCDVYRGRWLASREAR